MVGRRFIETDRSIKHCRTKMYDPINSLSLVWHFVTFDTPTSQIFSSQVWIFLQYVKFLSWEFVSKEKTAVCSKLNRVYFSLVLRKFYEQSHSQRSQTTSSDSRLVNRSGDSSGMWSETSREKIMITGGWTSVHRDCQSYFKFLFWKCRKHDCLY